MYLSHLPNSRIYNGLLKYSTPIKKATSANIQGGFYMLKLTDSAMNRASNTKFLSLMVIEQCLINATNKQRHDSR